jgi:2'-5' RNA ligase
MNCRPIEPENWHFTLAFLGEVPEQNLDALIHLIEKAVERPPKGSFSFSSFENFPKKHPSYLIAKAMTEPINEWTIFIERLRDMVSVAAPNMDRKPWIPHVTIARAKKRRLIPKWNNEIEKFSWTPKGMTLVQSIAIPTGSKYVNLHEFSLIV